MFIAAALAAAVGLIQPARAADTLTPVVMANPAESLSFSAAYLAEDLGIFKENGMAVKMILIPGVGTFNAVVSGSADFGQPSAITLTRAAAKGQRMLAIAETTDHPIIQVALRKDIAEAGGFDPKASFEKRAALLRGRTIAADATGSLIHGYVLLMAKRAGLDPSSVQIAFMQPPNMLAAFQTKQIDGFAMSPPWPLVPVLKGDAVMLASGPDGEPSDLQPFTNNVVVTRPDTCEKRRPLCVAMGKSFTEAEAYMRDHPDEALALLKKRFAALDDKVLAVAFETIRKISPNPPAISAKGLENAEVFNVDAGLMKPEDKLASYDGLYTDAFVK
ncbi:MAG TPA: ABC transporter substrate-binding protein [Stellaceae bacterium]|jgi:ABC-type nitrate/sulfonate/bicarbonate transport system substrate-binding protein|nr:ABC transporter substrate-binding protein [Stellaceae bacterium]